LHGAVTILPRDSNRAKPCFARSAVALALAALAASALFTACHRGANGPAERPATGAAAEKVAAPTDSMPHGTVRFDTPRGAWLIDVEIARTPEEHARGLMFRKDLAPDHGMIFVFDEAREQRFWMHNTYLRLDMIFLGDEREVVGIVENAEPQTDTGREVGKPARYVLEVAGGEAAAHAVGPGARAQFIGIDH
jgi:uncharacterized membrane protein (UPF0127 family)